MTLELRRLPFESSQPIILFAVARVALAAVAMIATLALGFPFEGDMALFLGAVVIPWTCATLVLAYRNPRVVLSLWTAAIDIAILIALEALIPEAYGGVRFVALFLIAVHAQIQGEQRGVAIGLLMSVPLAVLALIENEGDVTNELLAFYEIMFVAAAVAIGLLVGRLRATESAGRLRARDLTRRTLQGESEVRRRTAESIHDGPVQELIGLDMMLAAAGQAAGKGDGPRAAELIGEAREVAQHNVQALRDEIVDLGPYAFHELSYGQAVENCVPVWKRRYGVEVLMSIEAIELTPDLAGDLFRITQEAAVNAGRHAGAANISIALREIDDWVELRIVDDGQGFGDVDPLGATEPGHLGLAAMRERAEVLDGTLEIETSERGTKVLVRVPRPRRARRRQP